MDPQLPLPTPPSIYVAGPISAKGDVKVLVQALRDLRIVKIVSRWHDLPDEQTNVDPTDPGARRVLNDMNVADIDQSDIVVAWTLTGKPCTTYSEIGYALGTKKRLLWVQGPNHIGANIFDSHPLTTILTHLRVPEGIVPITHPKTAAWAVGQVLEDILQPRCRTKHVTGLVCQKISGKHGGSQHEDIRDGKVLCWEWSTSPIWGDPNIKPQPWIHSSPRAAHVPSERGPWLEGMYALRADLAGNGGGQ